MTVPEDAFEMNYVFTDGEGATDNNMGQNYLTLLDSNMTAELWAEKAMERQVCHCCLWPPKLIAPCPCRPPTLNCTGCSCFDILTFSAPKLVDNLNSSHSDWTEREGPMHCITCLRSCLVAMPLYTGFGEPLDTNVISGF